jgi:hypothetical protein
VLSNVNRQRPEPSVVRFQFGQTATQERALAGETSCWTQVEAGPGIERGRDAMGHIVGSCDFLDVLEEAAVLGTQVLIDLRDGGQFTDAVREVITEDGQDLAAFKNHGRIAVHAMSNARRAAPRESSYEGKLGQ